MIRRLIFSFLLLMSLLGGLVQPVLADDHHEDPAGAKVIFNGMTLLMHYYGTLRDMLNLDVPSVENSLEVMPFANIPREILPAATKFNSKGIDYAHSAASLFAARDEQNALLNQYRLEEAAQIGRQIAADLPRAREQLADMKSSLEFICIYLKIDQLPAESGIRQYYELILKDMLTLIEMLGQLEQAPSDFAAQLKHTELTMAMDPQTAFVGDQVTLNGRLTSQGTILPDRGVTIYLAKQYSTTTQTDSTGHFQVSLQVPELYQSVTSVQAVYIPEGLDIDNYMGSSSTALDLMVNYYSAELNLTMPGKAYPGQSAVLNGSFDYSQPLDPLDRKIEIYLDDSLLANFSAGTSFSQALDIPADIVIGLHTLIVTVRPEGRYAPVAASFHVDINLIPLTLDVILPGVVFVPGQLPLEGRVSSPLGPLPNVLVTAKGWEHSHIVTAAEGNFKANLPTGWGLSLLGFQNITLRVQSPQPWYTSLEFTQRFFAVNYVNCLVLLLVLVSLAFYLPRRLNKWFGLYAHKAALPHQPAPLTPVFSNSSSSSAEIETVPEIGEPSQGTLWNLYLRVLKLVQKLTRSVLKPQQTLREYARDSSPSLGPLARPFVEFTLLIEGCLYSNHKTAAGDLEKGQELSQSIHKEAKHEDI